MRKPVYMVSLLSLCLILAGCSKSSLQSKLVGLWANRYGANAWEFKEGGEVQVLTKENNVEKVIDSGTYKAIDGETIEAQWKSGETEKLKIRFNEDRMIMTLPDKSERVFQKVDRSG